MYHFMIMKDGLCVACVEVQSWRQVDELISRHEGAGEKVAVENVWGDIVYETSREIFSEEV